MQPSPVGSCTTVVWSIGWPVTLSVSTMVMTGDSPATKWVPFAGADVVRETLNSGMLRGSFTVQSWYPSTLAAAWQPAQAPSVVAAPPVWFAPVVQSIVSWQEPQDARDGTVFQLSTFAPAPVWHAWQFARLAGKAASFQVPGLPSR